MTAEIRAELTRRKVWAVATSVALSAGLVLALEMLGPEYNLGATLRTVAQILLALGAAGAALMVLSSWLSANIRVTKDGEHRSADIEDVVWAPHLIARAARDVVVARWIEARPGTKLGALCYLLMVLCLLAAVFHLGGELLVRAAFTLAFVGIVIIVGQNFLPHMGYSRRQRILRKRAQRLEVREFYRQQRLLNEQANQNGEVNRTGEAK